MQRILFVTVGLSVLATACAEDSRAVFRPGDFPLHARLGDTQYHGRGTLCLPNDPMARPCSTYLSLFPEVDGLVHLSPAFGISLPLELEITSGDQPGSLVLRPAAAQAAAVFRTDDRGGTDVEPTADFEVQVDGLTGEVDGRLLVESGTIELWGRATLVCTNEGPSTAVTSSGETIAVECGTND
jgi:hypothetical protein